jgi:hypothetical protein
MQKIFITFGAGSEDYNAACDRLVSQANSCQIFDKVIGFKMEDLKQDLVFWNQHSEFIQNNPRGIGYWLWKPYLILKTLYNMNNGDVLIYADSGCEIDVRKRNNILYMIENICQTEHIISSFCDTEKKWVKKDIVEYLNMDENMYLDTPQRQASSICIKKTNLTYSLVHEWYNACCNYHLIDDSPSISQNYNCFVENRHDQSIFSLLTKKYNLGNNVSLDGFAINIARNRTGKSRLNQ